jgi:hypothetical protein
MKWDYIDPRTKQPFQVVTGDKVPEAVVREFAKKNAPPPNKSPLVPVPILSMPTPFEYSDDSVWSSPKGPLGPGVIANTMSRLMKDPVWASKQGVVTPDVVYKEGNKGLIKTAGIAAQPLIPGPLNATFLRRMATQGGISAGEGALAGGTGNQIAGQAATGAFAQGALETLIGAGVRLPIVSHLAKKLLGKHALQTEQAATRTAQNAAGMQRNEEGKTLMRQMDERNIADLSEPLLTEHAAAVSRVKNANAAQARAHEETLYKKKVADQAAETDWIAQKAAADAAHTQATRQHAEAGAAATMEDVKQHVPWIRDLPSDGSGFLRLVVGDGQDLISAGYGPVVKAAQETARGTQLFIPAADAKALRVKIIPPSLGDVVKGTRTREKTIRPVDAPEDGVAVDAGDLIGAITSMKGIKRDWDLYHRTMDQITDAGFGIDPAARQAYKYASGTIQAADANNMLVFDPITKTRVVDPEALISGMLRVKNANILRSRDMGSYLDSPMLQAFDDMPVPPVHPPKPEAAVPPLKPQALPEPPAPDLPTIPERGPLNPKARSEPVVVEPPDAPDFGEITLPGSRSGRGHVGGALGALLGALGGASHGIGGAGIGGTGGYALGRVGGMIPPDSIKTTVPIPAFEDLLKALLMTSGTGVRALTDDPAGTNVDLMDAEIRAAELAGKTAVSDPNLQLTVTPQE